MNEKYISWRKEILAFFKLSNKIKESGKIYSPSGKFYLTISSYKTGENTWEYTRGVIKNVETQEKIADIKRNYSHFWYSWCEHRNGNEYLLCGEDYQGQTIVNVTKKETYNYFPEAGFDGHGFCWANVYLSPNKNILAVEGCYWAAPYDIVFFDFTKPDKLPLKEIKRVENVGGIKGWNNEGEFVYEREIEIRKSDGVLYEELSDDEQDILDNNQDLVDYKIEIMKTSLNDLKEM